VAGVNSLMVPVDPTLLYKALRHRKSRFDPNSCAFFSHRTQFVWIFQSSKTVTGKGCLQYRLKVVEGKRYRFLRAHLGLWAPIRLALRGAWHQPTAYTVSVPLLCSVSRKSWWYGADLAATLPFPMWVREIVLQWMQGGNCMEGRAYPVCTFIERVPRRSQPVESSLPPSGS
jgi:hypothetical protein